MKLFNYDSPFWSFMSRLADLIILSLLWIVFCIPVVTIGASTTAMYRVTLNMVRGEGSGVVRMFWDAFRLNLKQAVLIFLILLIPVLLVVYEFWMYLSGAVGQSMWLGLVFCCPSLILALVLAYVYPLLAQFDNSIKNTLKNACLLAIGSLPYSLVMAALNLLPVALFLFATSFFFRTAIFWVLIGGALVAFANSWLLRKVFKKNFGLD